MVDTDDTRRTMDDGRRTTPGVWHKLPTGELKIFGRCTLSVSYFSKPPQMAAHVFHIWNQNKNQHVINF